MARGDQIIRHWRLLQMLQRRGVGLTLREIRTELDVSERTLQRDFEFLQEVGFPIDFEEDDFGKRFWRLPRDFFAGSPLVISLTEAISLHLAEHLFAALAGTQFARGLESLLAKVRSQIPGPALEYFRDLDETFHVRRIGRTDYGRHAATIELLTSAARDQRQVLLRYRALWRTAEYETAFDPYGLLYFEGDLYAVGRSQRAGQTRVFKVARIVHVAATDTPFERPPGFSLAEYFQATFGIVQAAGEPIEVEVRFFGPAATLVEERVWHESQELRWLPPEQTLFETDGPPGELRARFRLTSVVEFKRWLRGFGESAEVVRPDWLRAELAAELRATLRLYE